jgi:glycosyltransferase involved in cell wall biosynthesis
MARGIAEGRTPRVLILLENAPVPSDRRVTQEALSLLANGYTVSVICPAAPGDPARETLEDIDVRRYRPLHSRGGAFSQGVEYLNAFAKTLWLMLRLLRSPGFDVIHACNPPDLFFLIAVPFKLIGKRFIFDQHDLSPELYSVLYGRDHGPIMSALRWSERQSYRHSDAVIASNESYKRLACSRGGVPPDRVFVVRNGPREGWPRPAPPDPSLKKGRSFLVVYMGVMGYQDGVDVLLRSVHTLVHTLGFHDATFALLGDGGAAEALRMQARALDVEDFVDFTGWISDEKILSRYLATADACVCPEPSSPLNDHSTFIKVMEYMACHVPIVAFDLPETRYSAGDAAAYAAPGDVERFAELVKKVLTDETLRAKLVAAAADRIPQLRWERQVPCLLAAYDRALQAEADASDRAVATDRDMT